jgi:hypothetical protein
MEIVTLHEVQQRTDLRKPLWPIHTTCNGNCTQGRACDCTSNLDTTDADDWEPLSLRDNLVFWTPVAAVTLGLVGFVLYAAGVRL